MPDDELHAQRAPVTGVLATLLTGTPLPEAAVAAAVAAGRPYDRWAAINPHTPTGDTLRRLAAGRGELGELALTRVDDDALLCAAAGGPTTRRRAAAARNPHTPPELLADLAGDAEPDVAAAAVTNPSTPTPAALARLAQGGISGLFMPGHLPGARNSPVIRMAGARAVLAAHPQAAPMLAGDPDGAARRAVAVMPGIATETVAQLCERRMTAQLGAALGGNPDVPDAQVPTTASAAEARARLGELPPGWRGTLATELFAQRNLYRTAHLVTLARSVTVDTFVIDAIAERFDTDPGGAYAAAVGLGERTEEPFPDGFSLARLCELFGAAGRWCTRVMSETRLEASRNVGVVAAARPTGRYAERPVESVQVAWQLVGQLAELPETGWTTMIALLREWNTDISATEVVDLATGLL